MEKVDRKQEVLLLTSSWFAQRDLCKNDLPENNLQRKLSPIEQLQEACWNGLFDDFLRSAYSNTANGDKIFLWKIHTANSFLCLQLSQAPISIDPLKSLDPYLFLSLKNYN